MNRRLPSVQNSERVPQEADLSWRDRSAASASKYASHTFDFPAVFPEFQFPRFLPPHDEISPSLIMYLIHTFVSCV